MYPISLNLAAIPILLIGEGEAFAKRKAQLAEMGATKLVGTLEEAAVVMVAGLPYEAAEKIAREARAAKKLVNVEDVPELCDFYFTSFVTRGELTIAVSTNGASPTLARRVRDQIAAIFGEEWAGRTALVKGLRDKLRGEGKSMKDVMTETDRLIHEKGWFA